MNTPPTPPRFDGPAALDAAVSRLCGEDEFPGHVNDQPGTGAQLLEDILDDLREYGGFFDPARVNRAGHSDVHDTCPAGHGPAAVHVTRRLGGDFLLVAVPVDRGMRNRAAVRALLAARQPQLAAALAAAERLLDASPA